MTYTELRTMMENLQDEYDHVGLRFEDKEYKVGDIVDDSKHNGDREDEREFPQYGTEEYNELTELPGVSTWNVYAEPARNLEKNVNYYNHAYIIVGNDRAWYDSIDDCVLDNDEKVIEEGKVAVIIK